MFWNGNYFGFFFSKNLWCTGMFTALQPFSRSVQKITESSKCCLIRLAGQTYVRGGSKNTLLSQRNIPVYRGTYVYRDGTFSNQY